MQTQKQSQISQIEVTAQVLDIIRAYEGHSAKILWQNIQKSIEDVPEAMLKEAIRYLKEKAEDGMWR